MAADQAVVRSCRLVYAFVAIPREESFVFIVWIGTTFVILKLSNNCVPSPIAMVAVTKLK